MQSGGHESSLLFETNNFAFHMISIRDCLMPQKNTEGAYKVGPNIYGKFRFAHLNWTPIRVLDVSPTVFLARKVQPLLIYVRGAGRLNKDQSNKHI
jgi:hypothetical protein